MGGLVPNTAVFRAKVWESDGIMRAWSLGMDEPFVGGHMTATLEGGGKQEARPIWRK